MMYFSSGTVQLYYESHGQGIPIIFVHGLGVDHRTLHGIFEPFFIQNEDRRKSEESTQSVSFQRIYINLPGMGKTKVTSEIQSSDDILNLLLQFIEFFLGKSKFILIGESYGGYLSRGILYHIRKQLLGVVFICPVIVPERENRTVPPKTIVQKDDRFWNSLTEEEQDDYMYSTTIISQENWTRFNQLIRSAYSTVNKPFIQNLFFNNYRLTHNIDQIQEPYLLPSLFLLGKQDSIVGYKDAWQIYDDFPNGSFMIINHAGHNLLIEQEKFSLEPISEFLAQFEQESDFK